MDTLRQLPDNKKCFDCQQKGTMYVVMNFGVFVCSSCAGIHREMTHKVKGISMSTFTDDDLKFLNEQGNANVQKTLMGEWSSKRNPLPEKSDAFRMKEFFKAKYVEKRFAEPVDDEDSDSSDDKKKKKKKDKKDKKTSKRAKPKPKAQSSSDEEEEEEKKEESEDEEPVHKVKEKKQSRRAIGAPPGSAKTKPTEKIDKSNSEKSKPKPVAKEAPQPQTPVESLLDFSSAPATGQQQQPQTNNDDWGDDWAVFDSAPAQQQPAAVPQQQQQQPLIPTQQTPAPSTNPAPQSNELLDIFATPPVTQQPAQQPIAMPIPQPQPNNNNFQPMQGMNMAQNLSDPFNDYMRNTQGQNPLSQQPRIPQAQPAMNMAMPNNQTQNPQQMAYMQQMAAMQQQMAQMNMNGQGANSNQMQQLQAQMQNMMSMMQQMMNQQPGVAQTQISGAQGYPQQQQQQQLDQNALFAQMQQQQTQMPPQQPKDSLSNLFDAQKKPAFKPPANSNSNQTDPFGGSLGTNQQPAQSSNDYNPFDL